MPQSGNSSTPQSEGGTPQCRREGALPFEGSTPVSGGGLTPKNGGCVAVQSHNVGGTPQCTTIDNKSIYSSVTKMNSLKVVHCRICHSHLSISLREYLNRQHSPVRNSNYLED